MTNYHNSSNHSRSNSNGSRRNSGGYSRRRSSRSSYNPYYSHKRSGRRNNRRSKFKAETISIDKLISKAVDSKSVNIYVDDFEYSQFDIVDLLKKNSYEKGYSNPTKIQYKAIPEILNGKDILGIASTGSGKTAAFLIPMINKAIKDRSQQCLIIVPTRELAMQIQNEFRSLAKASNLRSALIIGGSSIRNQIFDLKKNPNFIIGTPGRLKDLTERRVLQLNQINNVILDEVDRMLDMGFIADIKFLVEKLNKEKQSLFFSATMNNKAEAIANKLLHNPVRIEIEKQEPGRNVDQDVVRLERGQNKADVLLALLDQDELEKILIFTATKRGADNLCKLIRENNHYAEALHGGKRQNQRTKIIQRFKRNQVDVLVATDVASRGLDVDNITHVINYDMPQSYEIYTHRIGRTGRAGKKGFALTFV